MKPTLITPLNKQVEILYTQKFASLSSKRKTEIEAFWKEINKEGKFHRGEVFTVDSIIEEGDLSKILLNQTDYAHYLYSVKNHMTDKEGCKVVYGAGLVETRDHSYIFGEMGEQTAYPGRLQCVGGGLSSDDRNGNTFDIKRSVLRELHEELGISGSDHVETCTPMFIKTGGTYDFIVVLFHIKLKESASEFMEHYQKFTEQLLSKDEKPEFHQVVCLENNRNTILNFLKEDSRQRVDYLEPFLVEMAK